MTSRFLLDTHIVLWLDSGDDRLRPVTRTLIDECREGGGTILMSAISAWEIALLVDTARISLDVSVEAWVNRFLDRPGVAPAPLQHAAAVQAYKLPQLEHRDPADRLLIGTAITLGCPLVTYDERIGRFAARFGAQCGLAIAA